MKWKLRIIGHVTAVLKREIPTKFLSYNVKEGELLCETWIRMGG
jgi:hypothetical protein